MTKTFYHSEPEGAWRELDRAVARRWIVRVTFGVLASTAVIWYSVSAPSTAVTRSRVCWTEIKRDRSLAPERISGTETQLLITVKQSDAGSPVLAVTDVEVC